MNHTHNQFSASSINSFQERLIQPNERFEGDRVALRLTVPEDCNKRYVAWLNDQQVNQFLEVRWQTHTLESIRIYVRIMLQDNLNYLFSILDCSDQTHIGNLKIGPISPHYLRSEISYFIGEESRWGSGLATEAIQIANRIAFERFGLNKLQAGTYDGNIASRCVLEKNGYQLEGRLRQALKKNAGWEDHLWYGLLRSDWMGK